ncbi:hypothetical protein Ngar_c34040 [Candidatus Nitrososphaera gargensis Ga9.2]|uniref:Uncharacterized protein n=1 Tax=Nitrososphaera gargensis (strain Ga9.2) TaxID=1237085 RepID=K0IP12_NITGG|nr:hypothetical protein Ngar_c34040 [Candidatus Nitrososphaera gargensis Ga9.2]
MALFHVTKAVAFEDYSLGQSVAGKNRFSSAETISTHAQQVP